MNRPRHGQARPILARADDRQHEDHRQLAAEMLLGVVEDAPQGRVGPAHHPFHAVGGADEVALVDARRPAGADEQVLVVVGHADHFVRHDLADREDQIVPAFPHQPVQLHGPRLAPDALGGLGHELGRDLADRDHVVAPVVDAEQPLGHAGEHAIQLPLGHGGVRAQGRHNVAQPVAEIVVGDARQRPGHAVGPGEVGRQRQHLPPRLQSPERLDQRRAKFLRVKSVVGEPWA